jgi:anti-sigma regulatory factor (Ser/Thr protein kinase)
MCLLGARCGDSPGKERGAWSVSHHTLATDFGALSEARRYIRDELETSLESSKVLDAELLTTELVANAIKHAEADGAEIGLDIDVSPSTVHVRVEDQGRGLATMETRPRPDATGGRGLVLVDRISDRWGVHPGTPHSVWFELDR